MDDASADDLERFRERARYSLLENVFLKLWVMKETGKSDRLNVKEVQDELLRELEQHAKMADTVYLSDEKLLHLNEYQRALVADEYRGMVEDMKTFVNGLTDG